MKKFYVYACALTITLTSTIVSMNDAQRVVSACAALNGTTKENNGLYCPGLLKDSTNTSLVDDTFLVNIVARAVIHGKVYGGTTHLGNTFNLYQGYSTDFTISPSKKVILKKLTLAMLYNKHNQSIARILFGTYKTPTWFCGSYNTLVVLGTNLQNYDCDNDTNATKELCKIIIEYTNKTIGFSCMQSICYKNDNDKSAAFYKEIEQHAKKIVH